MTTPRHLPPDVSRRVINPKATAEFCGISEKTLKRLRDRRAIPDAIRLSDRRIGWRIRDLDAWLDCRAAGLKWGQDLAGGANNDNAKFGGATMSR